MKINIHVFKDLINIHAIFSLEIDGEEYADDALFGDENTTLEEGYKFAVPFAVECLMGTIKSHYERKK